MESSWAWMMTPILSILLPLLLSPLTQGRRSHTSTKPASTASARPPAMEACSTAAWSVGLRIRWTPVWWKSLTALPSVCRGHRVSRLATCIHVLLSTVSQVSVWFVSYSRELKLNILILLRQARFEYLVACDGQCSVTCGEGQQTREVICVGPRGEHLADSACSGLARPSSVQACRRPACHTHITWHVTDYGLVSEEGKKSVLCCKLSDLHSITLPLFSCECSALGAVVVVWGRGGLAVLIQIWTPTLKAGAGWPADPSLWRHAIPSHAQEHKVSMPNLNQLYTLLVWLYRLVSLQSIHFLCSGPKCAGSKGTWKHHERICAPCSRRPLRYVEHEEDVMLFLVFAHVWTCNYFICVYV